MLVQSFNEVNQTQVTETSRLLAATYCKPFWKEYNAAGINLAATLLYPEWRFFSQSHTHNQT